MSISTRDLLKFKKAFPEHASFCNRLLVHGLKGHLMLAYSCSKWSTVTSTSVGNTMNISCMSASILLKNLVDMGLLERKPVSNGRFMQFVYRRIKI